MDWNHAPGTLDTELFEEGRGGNGLAACERVRIKQNATDEGHDNNREAASENLRSWIQ